MSSLFVKLFDKAVMIFDEILKLCESQIRREIPEYDKERIIVAFNKHCERIQKVIDSYGKKR